MSLEFICFQSIVIHSLATNLPKNKKQHGIIIKFINFSWIFSLSFSLYSSLSMFLVSILFLFNLFLFLLPCISCSSRFERTTKKPHNYNNNNNNNQIHLKPIKIQFDDVVFLINSRQIGFFSIWFVFSLLISYFIFVWLTATNAEKNMYTVTKHSAVQQLFKNWEAYNTVAPCTILEKKRKNNNIEMCVWFVFFSSLFQLSAE